MKRKSHEGGKWRQVRICRLFSFTFSFSVIVTEEHFLAHGVLERMVTFSMSNLKDRFKKTHSVFTLYMVVRYVS